MNQLLFYLLQVIAASGLLYGYYHFALRNKKFHHYNRFYLLMAVVISTLIPFLNIPVYFTQQQAESSVMLKTLQVISSPVATANETVSPVAETQSTITTTWFTLENFLYLTYFIIFFLFLSRVFMSLKKIRSLIRKNTAEHLDKIKFVNTDEPGTPFSFFRWLFWNRKIELHSERGEQIFRHELFHIQQKHSWDIIFTELLTVVFWINPFFHLIKKELKAIHEFLADEFAIKENNNWQYAELLLMQAFNTNKHLVNPFFHNQIKRRIAMITSSTKPSYQYLRKMMVLPVAAIIVTLFAFNYRNKKNIDPHEFEKAINSITVVIDAGHGGTDAGAKTKDGKLTEADLSLAIAKKIESLAHDYNINVIMTREDEKFPGGATTKNDALRKRVELVNNVKPTAFIAIHMNTTPAGEQSDKSGFDAYVTKQRNNLADIKLATVVLSELKNVYTTREEIKQREDAGIFIIDKAKFPSLLLECGYINNPNDLAFINDKKNQELLAKAILKALVTFANRQQKDDLGIQYFKTQNAGDTTKPKELKGIKEYENYLVVINGVIQSKRGFQAIDTSTLSAKDGVKFTVYNDSTGIKKYGQKAKDGVIELITKKNSDKEDLKEVVVMGALSSSKQKSTDVKKSDKEDLKEVVVTGSLSPIKESSGVQVKEIALVDTTKPIKPQPLIVINGKVVDSLELRTLEPYDIERMSILMEDTAIAKYGNKAKNGVIEITTKKTTVKEVTSAEKRLQDDDIVFSKVDVEASFPGGAKEWEKFVNRNIDNNTLSKNGCKPGIYTVVVQFIVAKDGRISDVKALTKHGYGMEEQSIRLIQEGPYWIPAIQNGHNVKAYRQQPINFKVGKTGTMSQSLQIEKVRNIEEGKTSLTEIQSLFGEPTTRSIENNFIFWTYEAPGSRLDVQFNRENDRVINFRFAAITNSKKENIDYQKAKEVKENRTTFTDLEKLFGKPYQVEINNNKEFWTYVGISSRLSVMAENRKTGVISVFRYDN